MQFRDRLEHLPESDSELENVSSLPQGKNFEQLCDDLEPDGPTLYLLYRILSKTSHAGPYTVDQYMTAARLTQTTRVSLATSTRSIDSL
jgi:hypothetical protein